MNECAENQHEDGKILGLLVSCPTSITKGAYFQGSIGLHKFCRWLNSAGNLRFSTEQLSEQIKINQLDGKFIV
jgi:hypothetical protein